METLFARHKPKKGMVGLMLAGSLLIHGGLVGIATLWTPPQPEEHSVIITIGDAPPEGPGPIRTEELPQLNPPETPTVTATSEVVDVAATPPPVSDDPEFAPPPEPTPPRRPTVARSSETANHPTNTQATTRANTGPSGGGTPGSGNPAANLAGVWVMPHPPYPRTSGRVLGTGTTTVRITTDAAGRVSNAVILQSTGNPALDSHTLSYVRSNWRGPANASRTTQFVYELR